VNGYGPRLTVVAVLLGATLAVRDFIPGFDFVWQFGLIGGFVGTGIAARRQAQDPSYPALRLVWRWTRLGLAAGVLVQVVALLLEAFGAVRSCRSR
jgi:hypothetical protein